MAQSDAIKSVIDHTGGVLKTGLTNQASYSEDAVLTTNYLDDYIVRGNVFVIGIAQDFTADTPVYFTSEFNSPTINASFLLPISVTPTSGYLTLTLYEDTDYTGGTAVEPYNRNRTSSNTPEIEVNVNATGAIEGTALFTRVYGTAAKGTAPGGGSGISANAFIFDLNKRYLYELTCSESGLVGIEAEFAEI